MEREPRCVPEDVIGSLKSCLVEGDAEQRQCERQIRRRALMFSIALESVVVASLTLFPVLGKSERITYEQRILPPYAPHGPVRQHTPKGKPQTGTKQVCVVCFDPQNPPRPLKPGEQVDTTLNEREGDSLTGAPPGTSIPGGLELTPSMRRPEPPRERSAGAVKRLRFTTLEAAMLIYRVEPRYPPLAHQLHREGRVELRAIISTDGTMQSLEVASGDPLFYQSALAAVREWRYRPTYLDGQAVEIDTHITVIYTLDQ